MQMEVAHKRIGKGVLFGLALLASTQIQPSLQKDAQKKEMPHGVGGAAGVVEMTWLRVFRDPFPNMQASYSARKK